MVYNRYNINIVLQSILIALTPVLFVWAISKEYMTFTSITLVFIWILQITYLIYYLNKVNRDLARFLLAFKHKDSTMVFKARSRDSSFRKLYMSFNDILSAFGKIKLEKEQNFIFFKNTIEHVGIGLIAFNSSGDILLSNKSFKNIFNLYHLKNIESLNKIQAELPELIKNMEIGKQELIKILLNGKIVHLSIKASDFKLNNQFIRLISFQDIKAEIEQSEMDAWQKLIRVLTHEIMNSVSPINLLSASLINLFEKKGEPKKVDELSNKEINDSLEGLIAIKKRSNGLAKFVDDYRNLTQIPVPVFTIFSIKDLFQSIKILFKEELLSKNIFFETSISPENIQLSADERLLEQVIINLLKNAISAVENINEPVIKLRAFTKRNEKIIQVEDNGIGITKDQLENIFIPFYTTKEKGSGIGLSLSKQIMRMHKGNIIIQSAHKKGSVFSLHF